MAVLIGGTIILGMDAIGMSERGHAPLPNTRLDEQGRPTYRKVTLIQCTDSKRDEPAKARDRYDPSGYFRSMRNFAEAKGTPWYILSAKHGLVAPEQRLDPYDAFGLSESQAKEIAQTLVDKGITTVTIVAGKKYTNSLTPELEANGIDVIEIGRGLRIGKRIQKLNQRTRALENETLC